MLRATRSRSVGQYTLMARRDRDQWLVHGLRCPVLKGCESNLPLGTSGRDLYSTRTRTQKEVI